MSLTKAGGVRAMHISWDSWPQNGRVGRCRAQACAGQFVLLIPDTDREFVLYCEPPFGNFQFGDSIFTFDNYIYWEKDVQAMAKEWDIEWLEGREDEEIERRLFDAKRLGQEWEQA